MSIFKRLAFLAGVLILCFPLSAQHKFRASLGRAEVGASFIDLSALNQVLGNEGYAPLNQGIFAFGFSATRFHGHLVYGAKLYNYMIARSQFDFQLASMNYHYLVPYIGPVFYKDETDLMVYGTVGAGLGIANLKARAIGDQFHTNYNTNGLLVDAALHVSNKFSEVAEKNTGFEIGASLGYQYSPPNAFLIDNFGDTETGIPVSPAGFYFRLTLGMLTWQ